jgi:thiamine-monophosphate kinase
MVRRAGAQAGDHVFVSGTIGDAALGLLVREASESGRSTAMSDHLVALSPAAAAQCAGRSGAHACVAAMDVSDGSRPISPSSAASRTSRRTSRSRACRCRRARAARSADAALIEPILTGGEDYEILCAVAPRARRASRRGRGRRCRHRHRPNRRRRRAAALSRSEGAADALRAPRYSHF